MSLIVADRVRETATTTGTGDFTLAGAVSGFRRFSAVLATNDITFYWIWNRDVQTEWEVGIGTYSAANTLTRTSIIASSNSNAAVSFSAGTKDVVIDRPESSIPHVDPLLNSCRIGLDTNYVNLASDPGSLSTVYLNPRATGVNNNGTGKISLHDGYRWREYTVASAAVSVAVPSTLFRLFDVFAYANGASAAIETLNWNQTTGSITTPGASNATPIVVTSTSHGLNVGDMVGISGCVGNTAPNGTVWVVTATTANTFTLGSSVGNGVWTSGGTWYKIPNTRATTLDTQDGVLVKHGDTTRKYLGTAMTYGTSGQSTDSILQRLIWNYYNRLPKMLSVTDSTNTWNYTTASWQQARAAAANRVEIVTGIDETLVWASVMGKALNSTADKAAAVGVGINSVTANSAQLMTGLAGNNQAHHCQAIYQGLFTSGYTMVNWLEISNTGGTTTWYGDNGLTYWQHGMQANLLG